MEVQEYRYDCRLYRDSMVKIGEMIGSSLHAANRGRTSSMLTVGCREEGKFGHGAACGPGD